MSLELGEIVWETRRRGDYATEKLCRSYEDTSHPYR
jgi:hypothetical protein